MCAVKDPNSAKADSDLSQNLALVNRPRLVRKFNPAKVKLKLGALNLIGEKVQFANRLIVSSVDEGKVEVQPPATLYFVKIGAETRQGGSANIEVGGYTNTITAAASSGHGDAFQIDAPKVATDGSFATIELSAPADMRLGSYTIGVTSPNGTPNLVPVTVLPELPVPDPPVITNDLRNKKPFKEEISREFSKFAGIKISDGSADDLTMEPKTPDCFSAACQFTLMPKADFAVGAASPVKRTLKLEFINPIADPANARTVTIDVLFTVKK